MVYAKKGTDLSGYMSNLLVRPFVMPNGTQAYFGRAKAAQIGKLASLPEVAAIQDVRYAGDRPEIPQLGPKRAEIAARVPGSPPPRSPTGSMCSTCTSPRRPGTWATPVKGSR